MMRMNLRPQCWQPLSEALEFLWELLKLFKRHVNVDLHTRVALHPALEMRESLTVLLGHVLHRKKRLSLKLVERLQNRMRRPREKRGYAGGHRWL